MKLHALLLTLTLAAAPALAHTDEYLDSQPSPNGGQVRMAGVYHFELVVAKDGTAAKDNPVVVYVTDHADAKVPTAGASGTVTLLVGKEKITAKLVPDGDNRLKAMARYSSAADMKAVVSVTLPGKAAESARFTPLAAKAAKPADPHAGHKH